jgi:hypothetical protein
VLHFQSSRTGVHRFCSLLATHDLDTVLCRVRCLCACPHRIRVPFSHKGIRCSKTSRTPSTGGYDGRGYLIDALCLSPSSHSLCFFETYSPRCSERIGPFRHLCTCLQRSASLLRRSKDNQWLGRVGLPLPRTNLIVASCQTTERQRTNADDWQMVLCW